MPPRSTLASATASATSRLVTALGCLAILSPLGHLPDAWAEDHDRPDLDDPCQLIGNGGFEAGAADDTALDYFSFWPDCPTKVDGWCSSTAGTPDLFLRGSVVADFGIPGNFASGPAPGGEVDTWNGSGNDRYLGLAYRDSQGVAYVEGIYGRLATPPAPGQTYGLSLRAYVIERGPVAPTNGGALDVFLDVLPPVNGQPSAAAQWLGTLGMPYDHAWHELRVPFEAAHDDLRYLVVQASAPPAPGTAAYLYLDDVSIRPGLAEPVTVHKTVDDATPAPGQLVTYTLAVCNLQTTPALDVWIEDALPSGLSYVSGLDDPPRHRFDRIDGQTCQTVELLAFVDADAPVDTPIRNCLRLIDDGTACGAATDVEQCVDVVVAGTDLAIEKSIVSAESETPTAPLRAGDAVAFTIVIRNLGPGPASSIVVKDRLPAGLSLLNATGSGATYDAFKGDIKVPSLAPGAHATMDIVAEIDDGLCETEITNIARLVDLAGADADPTNDESAATVVVGPCGLAAPAAAATRP